MGVGHYENFPVASWLVPRRLRAPIHAIYRFARHADDIADEGDAPAAERLAALDALRAELADVVAGRLGKSFRPSAIRFTAALPKTRNAKVLRRAVRAIAVGADPGDLSSLEDPATLVSVRSAT